MNTTDSDFTGYVLAGGRSSRMGEDKALLEFGGRTMLERAAAALAEARVSPVKIVVNERQAGFFRERFPSFALVTDVYPERGALGGLHAALADCRTDFAVLLAVDLPYVTGAALAKLVAAAARTQTGACVPQQADGRLQPLAAVYRVADCRPAVEAQLAGGASLAMRDLLARIEHRTIPQTELDGAEDLFFNINRPEDLAALTRRSPVQNPEKA